MRRTTGTGKPHRWKIILALTLLTLITSVHLVLQFSDPEGLLTDVTQILLMPLLAAVLLSRTGIGLGRLTSLVLAALFFSWLGDSLPRFMTGDPAFLTMVGCFLIAQLFYILALWPYRASSVLAKPLAVIPYLLALAGLVLWCAPGAGSLLIPVLVYGVALTLMAILATGLGPLAGVGGAIFFISDAMIAIRSFTDVDFPDLGFWIMLSYVLGQSLIVAAVLKRQPSHALGSTGRGNNG